MKWTQPRLVAAFMLITCGLSWPIPAWVAWHGQTWHSPVGRAATVWFMFCPLLAALFLYGPILKQPSSVYGISPRVNRWWLIAWLLPAIMLLIGLVLMSLWGQDVILTAEQYVETKRALSTDLPAFEQRLAESPPPSPLMLIVWALPAGLTLNLIPSLAEEVGFRGLLFREVQGGFWSRSMSIALLWALWWSPAVALGSHYPITSAASHPLWSVAAFAAWCAVMSPLLLYVRVRSGSTIGPALVRSTTIALGAVSTDLASASAQQDQTVELIGPFFGVTGWAAAALVLVAFFVHDRFFATQRLM